MSRSVADRPRPASSRRRRLPFRPIVAGFLLASAALTGATAWLLASHLQTGALLAYLAGINLATFGAYLYDKSIAGGTLWRVPETVLHLLALAGGSPAALAGQHLLRHKTRKPAFQAWFWAIVVLQSGAVAYWLWQTGALRPA